MDIEGYIHAYQEVGIGLLFVGSIVDHTGIPVPTIVAVAFVDDLGISVVQAIMIGFAGGLVGDMLLLVFGRYILAKAFTSKSFGKRLRSSSKFLSKSPRLAISLGRFIPGVGKLLPVAAAAEQYPSASFVAYSAAGGLAHILLYAYLTIYVVASVRDLTLFHVVPAAMLAVTLILISWFISGKSRQEGVSNEQ